MEYTSSSSLPSSFSGCSNLIARIVARPRPSRVMVSGGSGGGEPSITRAGDPLSCANVDVTRIAQRYTMSALMRKVLCIGPLVRRARTCFEATDIRKICPRENTFDPLIIDHPCRESGDVLFAARWCQGSVRASRLALDVRQKFGGLPKVILFLLTMFTPRRSIEFRADLREMFRQRLRDRILRNRRQCDV